MSERDDRPPLSEVICPFVIGNETAKELLGLMLFMDPQEDKFNMLYAGDMGSAKSTLADYACKVLGKDRSAKITKNTSPGGVIGVSDKNGNISGGVLRTSEGKLIFADEMEKYDAKVKRSFLESMEERTVTITKGEMPPQTFESIVNVLATVNPKGTRWINGPEMNRIALELSLLSRFHVVVPFIDQPGEMYGRIGESFHKREDYDYGPIRDMIAEGFDVGDVTLTKDQDHKAGLIAGKLKDGSHGAVFNQITPRLIMGVRSILKARARYMGRRVVDSDFSYVLNLYQNQIMADWLKSH
jgi:hypothetical protein